MTNKYVLIKPEFLESIHFVRESILFQNTYIKLVKNEIPVIHELTVSKAVWSVIQIKPNIRLTIRNIFLEDAPLEKVIAARLKGLI